MFAYLIFIVVVCLSFDSLLSFIIIFCFCFCAFSFRSIIFSGWCNALLKQLIETILKRKDITKHTHTHTQQQIASQSVYFLFHFSQAHLFGFFFFYYNIRISLCRFPLHNIISHHLVSVFCHIFIASVYTKPFVAISYKRKSSFAAYLECEIVFPIFNSKNWNEFFTKTITKINLHKNHNASPVSLILTCEFTNYFSTDKTHSPLFIEKLSCLNILWQNLNTHFNGMWNVKKMNNNNNNNNNSPFRKYDYLTVSMRFINYMRLTYVNSFNFISFHGDANERKVFT